MKMTLGLAVVIGVIGASAAFAQTAVTPPPTAVITTSPDAKNAASPVAGANSFTEAEARSRLEANDFTNVTGLEKDDKSIWRGKATKNGTSFHVALDYQGTIVAE